MQDLGDSALKVKGSFSWGFADKDDVNVEELLTLKDMNFEIKKGEFVCVVGQVGCGKSSLLNAICGNMIFMPQSSFD